MELFHYKAMDAHGHIRRGRLSAPNLDDLEARLKRMGLDLVRGKPVGGGTPRFHRRVGRRDLIDFCFQLEQLAEAGVPLLQAIIDMRDTLGSSRFREVLSAIIERIGEGRTLSAALGEFPRIFDPLFVNLVRVGEQSGQLPQVLRDLTETLKWQDELASRSRKMLTYPAFVGTAVLGVVFFLMIYLVPQLMKFIASMEGTLPAHTRALLAVSAFFVDYVWFLVSAPIVAVGLLNAAARRDPAIQLRVEEYKLRIWLVGDIWRKVILARFARVFALMYGSGVPVLEIMRIAAPLSGNKAIEQAIANAGDQIAQGEGISRSLERGGLFPPLVLRMIKVGETTGALDKALANVSYFYDRDVRERIDKLESLMEPAMTVALGLLLGWIVLAVLGPVYDLIGRIKT